MLILKLFSLCFYIKKKALELLKSGGLQFFTNCFTTGKLWDDFRLSGNNEIIECAYILDVL